MLPPTKSQLVLEIHLFERAVGTKELIKVEEVHPKERLLLDVGTTITTGSVIATKKDSTQVQLARSVCVEEGARAAISRRITGRWRLIGYGIIKH